ncbi:hypothetical protein JJB07_17195 [Tumebacillus sp. ITR2]|uniref:DUF5643 domain-containing protein n=1 Tax=Tumebacillus amylolyticus TaxID=2801339 RepID=A0ABS1JDH2_9BACL|nr:hypothetical protein [Tumebacillus amylolyticus]MBL0388343.1 hypothetical protein [Tumebacillus amylolyticus]
MTKSKGRWVLVIATIVAFGLALGYSAWRGEPTQAPAQTKSIEIRTATDQGITVTFGTPQYDGVRMTLPYSIQGEQNLSESVSLDGAQVKINMQPLNGSLVSRRQPTSGRNAAGELQLYLVDDVADTYRLDIHVPKINEVEGNWNFQLNGQLSSKPITLNPNIEKKKGDLLFRLSTVKIGQGAGRIRYSAVTPATADHLQINDVEIQDERGRQMQSILTSAWNGGDGTWKFTQDFQLYNDPPKLLILKPYYLEGQGEMTPKHEMTPQHEILLTTPWDGKTIPTKIDLGPDQRAEVIGMKTLPDRTRLTYRVSAADPFLAVNLIRVFDADEHEYLPLDSFATPTEVQNDVYTFTREYPRFPQDKAFTFKTSTHDHPARHYLPELEVRIPLN